MTFSIYGVSSSLLSEIVIKVRRIRLVPLKRNFGPFNVEQVFQEGKKVGGLKKKILRKCKRIRKTLHPYINLLK
jgi:hypothetical protein